MPDQSDLFPDERPARKKRGVPAPEALSPPELVRIAEWAEEKVPWLSRGALESFESVETYVEACLEHFGGTGELRPGWAKTCMAWIRRGERRRLERMARDGNEVAREAWRDPVRWRESYDRRRQLSEAAARPFGPLDFKARGGTVIRIGRGEPDR